MSASQEIPNLRTLLGRGRGGRSRGRGRGRGSAGPSNENNEAAKEVAVQNTDQDAAGSRVSCVELGYIDDPYAKLFSKEPTARRLPLLNRGTYVRTSAIDNLIDRFIMVNPGRPKQIISLGAGTDTRYFRLLDKFPDLDFFIHYHEIDFPSNTAAKISAISRHPALHKKLQPNQAPEPTGPDPQSAYYSLGYNLHPLDLRTLANPNASFYLPNLHGHAPTLLLSECCLIYLNPETASGILATFLQRLISPEVPVAIVLYEQIRPYDAFGRTMISNLASRNITLQTLKKYSSLSRQRLRLKEEGFVDGFKAADTEFLWREWVNEEEKERVAGLEMLDELEELELLLKHYCVAWGWRDAGKGMFASAWRGVREQEGDDEDERWDKELRGLQAWEGT